MGIAVIRIKKGSTMKIRFLVLTILLLPSFLACDQDLTNDLSDRDRSFESIRRIDDFPLWTMTHYGDYDFEIILGIDDGSTQSVAPIPAENQKWACTCFATLNEDGDAFLGRNFDWYEHPALILFTNPPDAYASVSMVDISYFGYNRDSDVTDNPSPLLQAYQSPFDGMNEHGLAVGMMALSSGQGGNDPSKVTIGSLQAIRLMLDYARTVDEAITELAKYNIDFQGGPPIHYIITDAQRNSAIVEYIDHEMHVLRPDDAWQVCTNHHRTGLSIEQSRSECWRFRTAHDMLQEVDGLIDANTAYDILEAVSQNGTIWSMVYNAMDKSIQVVMDRKWEQTHSFTLD